MKEASVWAAYVVTPHFSYGRSVYVDPAFDFEAWTESYAASMPLVHSSCDRIYRHAKWRDKVVIRIQIGD